MKLIIDNIEHDWNTEIEIINEEFGFDCIIKYKDNMMNGNKPSIFAGQTETRNNCTEFHHRYNTGQRERMVEDYDWNEKQLDENLPFRSAFESDLHGTGGTKVLDHIESITVTTATKLHENY